MEEECRSLMAMRGVRANMSMASGTRFLGMCSIARPRLGARATGRGRRARAPSSRPGEPLHLLGAVGHGMFRAAARAKTVLRQRQVDRFELLGWSFPSARLRRSLGQRGWGERGWQGCRLQRRTVGCGDHLWGGPCSASRQPSPCWEERLPAVRYTFELGGDVTGGSTLTTKNLADEDGGYAVTGISGVVGGNAIQGLFDPEYLEE